MAAPSPEGLTNTTPLEKYLEHAQTMKIIDEKGHLLISGPPLILESADQDELLIFWKKPQTFAVVDLAFLDLSPTTGARADNSCLGRL